MRYQDIVTGETKSAFDEFIKYAKAVPADKLEWVPLENGRSVLDQSRECAKCADWCTALLSNDEPFKFEESDVTESKKEVAEWTTIEEVETAGREKFEKLYALFAEIPDEKLTNTKWLPFDGGRDFTYMEMMTYPRWNLNYHTGQVAYVQTLYGDKDMH